MKTGRPKKYDVNTTQLAKLAGYGNSMRECADILGVPESVLSDTYRDVWTKGRESLKQRLRKKQIDMAMSGNVGMLVWLGKQYLGQAEKSETSGDIRLTVTYEEAKPAVD